MSTHVLVGFDESPQAEAALTHALTRFPEATVSVVHVNDPREWMTAGDEDDGAYFSQGAYDRVEEAAERTLAAARELAAEHGREVRTAVRSGSPARELVRFAEAEDVDHVVVGSHGRRGLARFLLGSVSEAVVKRSPVPVTVMRTTVEE